MSAVSVTPDVLRDTAWMDRGLCVETDPDAFFPGQGEPAKDAKQVCRACEVRAECLEYALQNRIEFGIWGGTSEMDRRAMRRERRTG